MSGEVVHSEGRPLIILEVANPSVEQVEQIRRAVGGNKADVVVITAGMTYTVVTRGVVERPTP